MTIDEPDLDYTAATAMALAEEKTLLSALEPSPQLPTALPDVASPEQKAANLRAGIPGAYLYGTTTSLFGDTVDVASCRAYLHDLLKDAGDPTDPLARMMIEQLALAHHAIGRLHVRAATRQGLAEVIAYHAALARLMNEFRKTSLALQGLRGSAGEQAGQLEQRTHAGQPATVGRVSDGEAITAGATPRSELGSNHAVEGRERRAKRA